MNTKIRCIMSSFLLVPLFLLIAAQVTAPRAQVTAQSGTGSFLVTDMLGRPTDHSATVNLVPAEDLQVYLEYGAAPGVYTAQTQPETHLAGKSFEVTLEGLQPNTRTYYRTRYRQPGAAEFSAGLERSFWTQRASGSTFTFDIQGDSHPERLNKQFDPTLYTRALLNAAADRPDFYITIGDDFSVDTLRTVNADTVTQLYVNQRQYLGLVGAPVFLVNGNHEQAALANLDGTPNNVAVWAQTARNAYYPQPAPDGFYTGDAEPVEYIGLLRDYYAFTWGDALFVVIDPYWHSPQAVDNPFGGGRDKGTRDLWNNTLGETQYQWFKHTLETSTARYKFVFAHHVNGTGRGGIELAYTYEWGDIAQYPTKRPGWGTPIHQLMAQNHVTIFFQGHDHIFVRQELDGVIYQTLPEPANPFYTYENADAYLSRDEFPNSGHVRVAVSPEQVTVSYVRSFLPAGETGGHVNGEVAFSYVVPGSSQTPTPTPVVTASPKPTRTPSPTVKPSRTPTPTRTRAPSPTVKPSRTPARTPTSLTGLSGSLALGHPIDGSIVASLRSNVKQIAYVGYGAARPRTPTRAPSPTIKPSRTPTRTPTRTPSPTATASKTPTATPTTATGFSGSIVLGSPAHGSVVASLFSGVELITYLEYGTAPSVYTGQTAMVALPAEQPVEVTMEGLQPDTAYFYRLRFRAPGETVFAADVEHVFHTQRPPGSTFAFTLDADPHYGETNFNSEVYGVTLRGALADHPDFHINLGDTFMAEKLAPTSYDQVAAPYDGMRPFFGLLAPSAPLFLVNGNHDGELGWKLNGTADNLAIWATQARRSFYPNPAPGGFYSGSTVAEPFIGVRDGYYAWNWGDALFIVLDPFWYSPQKSHTVAENWNYTLGEAQYQWLKQTLETSSARFKFVFAHNLVGGIDTSMRGGIEAADKFEWGGLNANGTWGLAMYRPGWPAPIHQLLVQNGVTIFFHGHDHLFVKQDLDGIVYQECPQPSYALYDRTSTAVDYGYTHGDVLGCCGYLRITVSPSAVTVDYVRSYLPADENAQRWSGQVSYTYTVTAP